VLAFDNCNADFHVVHGQNLERIGQLLLCFLVKPAVESIWPSRPGVAERVPKLQVGNGGGTQPAISVRRMSDKKVSRNDMPIGDGVSTQYEVGMCCLVGTEIQATSGLAPLEFTPEVWLWPAVENFKEWLTLKLTLHDIASLRDHDEPVVRLDLGRRLAGPDQVRGNQRHQAR
jgi:hypothetical protein